jgi:hypothetical protein
LCLDSSILSDVVLTIGYGKGGVVTSILTVSGFNDFD